MKDETINKIHITWLSISAILFIVGLLGISYNQNFGWLVVGGFTMFLLWLFGLFIAVDNFNDSMFVVPENSKEVKG